MVASAVDVHGVVEGGEVPAQPDMDQRGGLRAAEAGVDPEGSVQIFDSFAVVETRHAQQVSQLLKDLGAAFVSAAMLLDERERRVPMGRGLCVRKYGVGRLARLLRVVDRLLDVSPRSRQTVVSCHRRKMERRRLARLERPRRSEMEELAT